MQEPTWFKKSWTLVEKITGKKFKKVTRESQKVGHWGNGGSRANAMQIQRAFQLLN